ncbi:MAG: methionyl-tRNA formyltransferase [Bacteroidetes bacterium]|nr:methionyl-tRNA formyltransferase [Bacteroidota bacterium]
MRVVFMGTPDFAVGILNALIDSKHEVIGVVTAADKPAGRGLHLRQSAVKERVVPLNIPILQPEKLKDSLFLDELKKLNADLFVVVAFRMLPKEVWEMPKRGTINLHASLLPQYRGAAPINWAIINGEKETGVTTFFINEVIDTGDILLQRSVSIGEMTTAGELHDKLMTVGAQLTVETLDKLEEDSLKSIQQDENIARNATHAPKIFKETCEINWDEDFTIVQQKIRGLSPYPAAWCRLTNIEKSSVATFKIFDAALLNESHSKILARQDALIFPCKNGSVLVRTIQQEGKRKMSVKEWLAGNNPNEWVYPKD